jgi:dCMP deaminase
MRDESREPTMTWDEYFIRGVRWVASKSKDPRTQVGCLIVSPENETLITCFNGLPRGVEDTPERYERPLKDRYVVHSESNGIALAAKRGIAICGCSMFISLPPCCRCSGEIMQAGIVEVVVDGVREQEWFSPRYTEECAAAEEILKERGVLIRRAYVP